MCTAEVNGLIYAAWLGGTAACKPTEKAARRALKLLPELAGWMAEMCPEDRKSIAAILRLLIDKVYYQQVDVLLKSALYSTEPPEFVPHL